MSGMDFDKEIAQIYRDMELYLIESMQRNLAGHLAEEVKTGLSYPQWQAEKLKELKRYQRENRKIVRSQTEGLSEKVAKHMKSELRQGSKHELKRYREALGKGYKPAKVMRRSFFKVNDRKVSGMINALQNDLGAANTAVLRMMNDTYRQTIFRAGMYASNGVMTETQAYDMAVKDFLNRGINCIEYRDGRRVNIADYASMAVRTANQRAYMVGEGEFRKSIGETFVIISHHATACKLCRPFERKVLIDDVYSGGKPDDGDYMLLSEAMKLGLFHPRCRHGLGTYYPELEEINHYNNEENDVSDYGRHNRAHIENMVQRYKRLTVGSVDPENVARYQAKLKEWDKKLEKYSNSDIIEKKPAAASTMFVSRRDQLYINAAKIPPLENVEDVVCHADSDSFAFVDPVTGEVISEFSAHEMAAYINASQRYEHGKTVRLISCSAGAKEDGLAQQLADELNAIVIAPTETLYVTATGDMYITDSPLGQFEKINTGEWKIFSPRRRDKG